MLPDEGGEPERDPSRKGIHQVDLLLQHVSGDPVERFTPDSIRQWERSAVG
jgi:hypothetical protein